MRDARAPLGGGAGAAPDTIFAPASGSGRAAIAVIRISGPGAHEAIRSLTRSALAGPRELVLRGLHDRDGSLIDRAMVVVFPEGACYTGEAMAEIHCHGGRAVVADVLAALGSQPGCRLAEPGEFTLRAFLHGKMDLSEAEGLSDLIAAETRAQRRQALRIHAGAVARESESWRAMLLRARALVEVTIDWVDDEVPEDVAPEVRGLLTGLEGEMQAQLSRSGPAERMRAGFEVAIVGPPNVGKSSLLNAIAGREAAIVSEIAGTTRDVIELRFDLSGIPVVFLDTAGIREARDTVEAIGVDRAVRRAEAADLRVIMSSADTGQQLASLWREGDIRVWSKSDLGPGDGDVAISVIGNRGVDALLAVVEERLAAKVEGIGLLGHARQRIAVGEALGHIRRGIELVDAGDSEVLAEELRLACGALDRLVGRIGVEDVLGEVFGAFCLGK